MIYLFSQIAISLALASIVGGAIGWLAHRARAGKQISQLQTVVSRQQQQVSEAQTQVSILTDDFDDLKSQSEAEIAELQQDNQKIPALNQNLEKSQLLVRQLMQQHKAEIVELVEENEKLNGRAKQFNDQEKALTKLQAELDIERRRNKQLGEDSATDSSSSAEDLTLSGESQSELPLDLHDNNTSSVAIANGESESASSAKSEYQKPEVASVTAQSELAGITAAVQNTGSSNHSKLDGKPEVAEQSKSATPTAAETEAELKQLRDQLAADLPDKHAKTINQPKTLSNGLPETNVDHDHLEPLFDPVDQQDDLKQIFGIGPVTEKTLNKLGITSYSQLAELKQHDIEKIADALQIFPGRIERDNWVGGARAQLEEVLEDL